MKSRLSKMGIGAKLFAGFGVVLVLVVALMVTSVVSLSGAVTVGTELFDHYVAARTTLADAELALLRVRNIERQYGASPSTASVAAHDKALAVLDTHVAALRGIASAWNDAELAAVAQLLAEQSAILKRTFREGDSEAMAAAQTVALPAAGAAKQAAAKAQDAGTSSLQREIENAARIAMGTGLLTIALGFAAMLILRRSIMRPIRQVVEGLQVAATSMTNAADQVAQSSQDLARGASEQAGSLEVTSSSLEELSGMTRVNADNSRLAAQRAAEARELAEQGSSAMEGMAASIVRMKDASDATARIIKTIDEIAFQTNLLALNAAVEAARAGDAGRGFAVVAEEVRNLAQRSAESAKGTEKLIEQSRDSAEDGVSATREVSSLFLRIAGSVVGASSLAQEVAAASGEQARGIEQLSTAIAVLDAVTQGNAASAEESASASEELSAQARDLLSMIDLMMGSGQSSYADKTTVDSTRGRGFTRISEAVMGSATATGAPSPGVPA